MFNYCLVHRDLEEFIIHFSCKYNCYLHLYFILWLRLTYNFMSYSKARYNSKTTVTTESTTIILRSAGTCQTKGVLYTFITKCMVVAKSLRQTCNVLSPSPYCYHKIMVLTVIIQSNGDNINLRYSVH